MQKMFSLGFIFTLVGVLMIQPVFADQDVILSYETARDSYLYPKIYPSGGKTFYCSAVFTDKSGLQVEHVYPASWMKETAGCPSNYSRKQCREHFDRFNIMEADLHNLFPDLKETNQDRSNYVFGIIGEDDDDKVYPHPRVPGGCDFEVDADKGIVEPGKDVRGDAARAVFYMYKEYGAPIDPEMGRLLVKWHRDDPPSDFEKWRNNKIEKLQGTRNPYIDNPLLANTLPFANPVNGDSEDSDQECLIKGNISKSGKIYHMPGSRHYDSVKIDITKGERWFCTLEEAVNAGWRAPQ